MADSGIIMRKPPFAHDNVATTVHCILTTYFGAVTAIRELRVTLLGFLGRWRRSLST